MEKGLTKVGVAFDWKMPDPRKNSSFGSSRHSAPRHFICCCLPTFFDLAFSVASILPTQTDWAIY